MVNYFISYCPAQQKGAIEPPDNSVKVFNGKGELIYHGCPEKFKRANSKVLNLTPTQKEFQAVLGRRIKDKPERKGRE
jgi:hypothetical protein